MNKIYKNFDPDKWYKHSLNKLKLKLFPFVMITAVATMSFSVVGGLVMLFLAGAGLLALPDKVLVILATSTVGTVGTVMLLFYRFFFRNK